MKIFLYEYTCAGGMSSNPRAVSLGQEGWAMLSALAEDLVRVPGVDLAVLLKDCLKQQPCGRVYRFCGSEQEEILFRQLAGTADHTLVIAPEFDDILSTRCRWVEAAGGRLLGPALPALSLTADKWQLSRHLRENRLPTPESWLLDAEVSLENLHFPLVLKPRCGAGSQATFLVRDREMLKSCLKQAREEETLGDLLLQPWIPGIPASVALLVGQNCYVCLPPAFQHLSTDGRFHYLGGSLPLPPALAQRASWLAERAVACVPGLRGYVGVDLVLGKTEAADWIIEINPRLTTSYIGLRALAETNLAEALLQTALKNRMPSLVWKNRTARFTAAGQVSVEAFPT